MASPSGSSDPISSGFSGSSFNDQIQKQLQAQGQQGIPAGLIAPNTNVTGQPFTPPPTGPGLEQPGGQASSTNMPWLDNGTPIQKPVDPPHPASPASFGSPNSFKGFPLGQIYPGGANGNMTGIPLGNHFAQDTQPQAPNYMEMGLVPPQGQPNDPKFLGAQPGGVPLSNTPATTNYAGGLFNMPKNSPQPAQPNAPWLGGVMNKTPPGYSGG